MIFGHSVYSKKCIQHRLVRKKFFLSNQIHMIVFSSPDEILKNLEKCLFTNHQDKTFTLMSAMFIVSLRNRNASLL